MQFIVMDLEWNNTYAKKADGYINEIIEFKIKGIVKNNIIVIKYIGCLIILYNPVSIIFC